MGVFAITGSVWSQQSSPPDPVGKLIVEICDVASIERGLAALDTRLQAASLVRKIRPGTAKEIMTVFQTAVGGVEDYDGLSHILSSAVEILLELEPEEALHLASAAPHQHGLDVMDPLEAAYDTIVAYYVSKQPERADTVLEIAHGAGAFKLYAGLERLRQLLKQDVGRARELFVRMMLAFPGARANERDMMFLLEAAGVIAPTSPVLAVESAETLLPLLKNKGAVAGEDVTLTTKYSIGGKEIMLHGANAAILFQTGAILKLYAPQRFEATLETFESVRTIVETIDPSAGLSPATPIASLRTRSEEELRIGHSYLSLMSRMKGLRYGDALTVVESVDDPEVKAMALANLLQRGDGRAPDRKRAAAALTRLSGKIVSPQRRSYCFGVLIDAMGLDSSEGHGAVAADELAATASELCSGAKSARPRDSLQCLRLYSKLAGYMYKRQVQPDDQTAPSVKARWLLLRLQELLRKTH
jgi:hypothetical protein